MPRHLSIIAVLWVATLAGAYIAGRVAGPLLPPEEQSAEVVTEDERSSPPPVANVRTSQAPKPAVEPEPEVTAASASPVPRRQVSEVAVPLDLVLREALEEPDQVEKMIGFAEVLREVDATTIATLVAEFDSQNDKDDWHVMQHRQLLYYKWGTLNGDAALAYLEDSDVNKHHKRYLQSSVLSGWASKDADSAIAWAQENHEGDKENPHMGGIIAGLAKTDLSRASDLLQELPYGSTRGRAAHEVVRQHMRVGEEDAKRWAQDLPANELKDGVVSMIVRELAKESASQAAEWLDTMDDVDPKKSVSSIARQWARDEPLEAANWVASFEDDETRRSALPNVISTWSSQDMQAAGEWLGQYPATPERDAAIASYAYRLARTNNEAAQAWADSIGDEKQRERVLRSVKHMSNHSARGRER